MVSLEPGSPLGPYRIVAPLGRGGMASVYRARDPALDRDVALKVLPAEFLHDPAFAERFRQEARVVARLEHPHVVPVHAFGIDDGRPWMALRLLSGGSLADRLRKGPLAVVETARLLGEIASALDDAHARGVVHRDVKPANILLDEGGHAYLADFGIARMLEGSAVVTATGMVQGTPAYMAPEQAMGTKVDRLADVYALGVVAFECLTGRVPYTGTTPVAVLMKHVSDPVPEPAPGEVPGPLTPVLRRCLAKDPAERWPSAGAFSNALARETARLPPVAAAEEIPTLAAPLEPEIAAAPAGPTLSDAGEPVPRAPTRLAPAVRPAPVRAVVGHAWLYAGLALGVLAVTAAILFAAHVLSPSAGPPPPSDSAARALIPTPKPLPPSPPTAARPNPAGPPPARPASGSPRRTSTPRRATGVADEPAVAPAPAPTTDPHDLAALYRGGARVVRPPGPVRVYCEAKLEPVLFKGADAKDVADSLADLREALARHGNLELVHSPSRADAIVQVLERGRQPATVGMRKVRVRVVAGSASVELVGQDSMTSSNTWSGAAGGAAKQVETWLAARHAAR